MVYDKEIDIGIDRLLEREETGIDGRADFGDASIVGELQPVESFPEVSHLMSPSALIAERDDVFESCHG